MNSPICIKAAHIRKPSRGFSIVEVIIASTLFGILMTIVAGGLVLYSRAAQATMSQERINEDVRRFSQRVSLEMADAASFDVINATTVDITRSDGGNVRFQYLDADNQNATIRDNTVVMIETPAGGNARPAVTFMRLASRVADASGGFQAVFASDTDGNSPSLTVTARLGDTTLTANTADDLETGRGYQSFRVNMRFSLPPSF